MLNRGLQEGGVAIEKMESYSSALAALCHFCEHHGPRVLFLTKAVRTEANCADEQSCSCAKYAEKVIQPCEACCPFSNDFLSYHTKDEERKACYLGGPSSQDASTAYLQQACVRSLSSEVSSCREGSLFFSDPSVGHVLSQTFIIKDAHARGFQRLYSVILIHQNQQVLLSSWPTVVPKIRDTIEDLKAQAAKVYDQEQITSPQRAIRLTGQTWITSPKPDTRVARSIINLTGNGNLFSWLHREFCGLLQLTQPATKAVSNCVSYSSFNGNGVSAVGELRRIATNLGREVFRALLTHLLNGRQLVVQGTAEETAAVVSACQLCLPPQCCRALLYSEQYFPSTSYNVLGLSNNIYLPILPNDTYLLTLGNGQFTLNGSTNVSSTHLPSIVLKLESLVLSTDLQDHMVFLSLCTALEEYFGLVEVVAALSASVHTPERELCVKSLNLNKADIPVLLQWHSRGN